jgi:hypothetical protein
MTVVDGTGRPPDCAITAGAHHTGQLLLSVRRDFAGSMLVQSATARPTAVATLQSPIMM